MIMFTHFTWIRDFISINKTLNKTTKINYATKCTWNSLFTTQILQQSGDDPGQAKYQFH